MAACTGGINVKFTLSHSLVANVIHHRVARLYIPYKMALFDTLGVSTTKHLVGVEFETQNGLVLHLYILSREIPIGSCFLCMSFDVTYYEVSCSARLTECFTGRCRTQFSVHRIRLLGSNW